VNKALRATHSRREADKLIDQGRVTVNGRVATQGSRLLPGDIVELDGRRVAWQRLNLPTGEAAGPRRFVWLKMWKPKGVVCTTDQRQKRNIIDAIGDVPGVRDRFYPVGRLDADSTGLILLTSDGNLVNRLLRAGERKRKVYLVATDRRATDAEIRRLASGVTITTVAQRDGKAKPLTAPTRPCIVERAQEGTGDGYGRRQGRRADDTLLRIVLEEGRNRQIRRMCEALGLRVVTLHRVGFSGINLDGCPRPGAWTFLTDAEIDILEAGARQSAS